MKSRNAIIWPSKKQLPAANLEEQLCARLSGRVLRAYFFGSYGTKSFGAGSDVDLILICDTSLPFVERAALFGDLVEIYANLDLLVYTEDEFAQQLESEVGFWRSVKDQLRELPIRVVGTPRPAKLLPTLAAPAAT